MNNGAAVTLTGADGDTVLGKYALSSGTATISGAGSTLRAGNTLKALTAAARSTSTAAGR